MLSTANVLGRMPLMPLFLLGNFTPTILHQVRQHRRSKFPHGLADAADTSGKKGSNVYEVLEHMAVGVWAGQTSPGPRGPLSGCD